MNDSSGQRRISHSCPKEVKRKILSPLSTTLIVIEERRRCDQPLSPSYKHCTDHITDREFFARKEQEMPEAHVVSLIKQVVGLEKAIKKQAVGPEDAKLYPRVDEPLSRQYMGLRKKYGNTIAEMANLPDRMNAHKLMKQERTKADVLEISDLPQYKR